MLSVTLQAVEAMVTYYVDIEEYDKGRAVVEDYVSELSLESASEMASTFSKYVQCNHLSIFVIKYIYCFKARWAYT